MIPKVERLHQSLVFHAGRLGSDYLARNSASSGTKLLPMSVGVLLEGKHRQCHARSCPRQGILHPVPFLTGIITQCCGERRKLGLHSAMVWINSLQSLSQTMPITGQCREDKVGGCSHLGCSQQHIPYKPASQEMFQ